MRTTLTYATAAAVVALIAAGALPANAAEAGPGSELVAAVAEAAPDLVGSAAPLADTSSGVEADLAQGEVTLPGSSNDPIVAEAADGTTFSVALPEAGSSDAEVSDGAASYDHGDGSSSVVFVNPDASVTITSVIEGADSPSTFSYEYDVALELFADGGVVGYDSDGELAVTIALPWALDANGRNVDTWYSVEGNTLTQHVDHRAEGVAYPVVADPVNYGGNFMYTKILQNSSSQGTIISVYPALVKFPLYSNDTIFANYKAIVPSTYETQKYRDQLICHVWNAGQLKTPWNLDSWRPNVGYNATVLALCNP
ncbi:DUF2599 domain-containing protein [Agromyces sp. PvR057]|uniref:DUF2599 domain-containing protein n=1 Tax=Agromyces sp. PvR057 TaxID=3156403 RepID=UPI0033943AF6